MRRLLNVAYQHLIRDLAVEARQRIDDVLTERPLSEIEDPRERAREERRRYARDHGLDQSGALRAMGMPTARGSRA